MWRVLGRSATVLLIAWSAASVEGSSPVSGDVGAERSPRRLLFTQVPLPTATQESPAGALVGIDADELAVGTRIVLLDTGTKGARVENLTPGFAAAGRQKLSFDAQRILFVGRLEAGDAQSVWEMQLDTRAARQITDCPGGCAEAIYLSTMYDMGATGPYLQIAARSCATDDKVGALYACRLDGSGLHGITFTPFHVSDPFLISDGRLLFSLHAPSGGSSLMTIFPDGTDLFPFAGLHQAPLRRKMPCETPDGKIVFVESGDTANGAGARLVAVARTRSLHTRRVLIEDAGGWFHSPYALREGGLLVSRRGAADKTYGVYKLANATGARLVKLFDDPRWHDIEAEMLEPRQSPEGRSSVVTDRGQTGQLYGLDVYLSSISDRPRIRRGDVKRIRVIAASTRSASIRLGAPGVASESRGQGVTTGSSERVLGEAPVESDGSFFVEIPARTPLRLETLDADGRVLRAMSSYFYFWVMPNERRGCIGCHEDRELTPPNRQVTALRKAPHRLLRKPPPGDQPVKGVAPPIRKQR